MAWHKGACQFLRSPVEVSVTSLIQLEWEVAIVHMHINHEVLNLAKRPNSLEEVP